MTRITGSDAKAMMEAYTAVYASQELTEEQVWEEVQNWVNSLLEEGYDLSEYTWEEMYDSYLSEAIGQPGSAGYVNWQDRNSGQVRSGYKSSSDGKLYRNYNDALAARNSRRTGLAIQQGLDRTYRAGGGNAAVAQGRLPSEVVAQGSANLQRQQRPAAPAPTTRPAGGAPAPTTRPAGGAPAPRGGAPAGNRVTPTGSTTTTPANAPAAPSATPARPSLQSGIQDLQRMRAASLMRQQGRTMPNGSIPTGSSLAPRPAAAPTPSGALAATASAASRPAAFNPTAAPVATKPTAAPVRRPAPTRAPILQRQSFDPFDIVIGHLIDEGYAEDEKAALVIMTNMSEEWRESILEGSDEESLRA